MYIQEAVRKALEEKCGMTREEWEKGTGCHIIPEEEYIPLEIYSIRRGERIPRWNPTPLDLLADDWKLVSVE